MQPLRFLAKPLYAAIFAGATALALAAPAAQASIVYTNLAASPLDVPNNVNGLYLNVVTGVSGTTPFAGYDINIYRGSPGLTFFGPTAPSGILATGTAGSNAQATALTQGQLISAAGQYNTGVTRGTSFQLTGQEFVGFRFLNESTTAIDYGWLLLKTTDQPGVNDGFPAQILGYAYENTGASILAGQTANAVPEPATLAMCLPFVGALAFRARKRRTGTPATA